MNIVAHNVIAINTQRQFGINSKSKAKSAERLTSGLKINRASDDAAGLAISEKMRRQIRGLSQGVENTQDGVSLCQVADGALAEVSDMLHRITQLSVKAANGTNTTEDREYIQNEIQGLFSEIDKIGDTTTFNNQPIFKGTDNIIYNADGTPANSGSVSFGDYSLTDVDLGQSPFSNYSSAYELGFQAIVKNEDSALNGQVFNLIYGNGGTSSSSVRITDSLGNKTAIDISSFTVSNFTSDGNTWSRDLTYTTASSDTITITQSINTQESDTEKNYVLSYTFDTSDGMDVANFEFMFHADTAYNNNDICESYFVDGERVEQTCVYSSSDGSELTDSQTSTYLDTSGVPSSFSIVDAENALTFSEKISFASGNEPDSLSIGYYYSIKDWSYYDSSQLNSNLGSATERRDLGFSLYYDLDDLSDSCSISFNYGIADVTTDSNLQDVPINIDNTAYEEHINEKSIWIQSGSEAGDGMYLTIGEMNTNKLGIKNVDVSTAIGAKDALGLLDSALKGVSNIRSTVGAQQNRLEHIISNEMNVVENTTAAESRIRDTDMAKEMVTYSNINILEQAGFHMMAQANQSNQGVLSLLQ